MQTAISRGVLMAAIALAVSLALGLGTPGPIPSPSAVPTPAPASTAVPTPPPTPLAPPRSQLPATQPGLDADEGVFLVTAADDGSRAVYFIAANARHSLLASDLLLEQQLNPLWPVRFASRDEVLAYPEAAPVGSGRAGLLGAAVAEPDPSTTDAAADAQPVTAEVSPMAATGQSNAAPDVADVGDVSDGRSATPEAAEPTDLAAAPEPRVAADADAADAAGVGQQTVTYTLDRATA